MRGEVSVALAAPAAVRTHGAEAFVRRSVSGRRWLVADVDDRRAFALAQSLELPVAAARSLLARGIAADAAADYLDPTLRASLPDPSRLADMDRAADRLARAIMDGESVAVFADYDVDGATSSAVIGRFLSALGRPCRLYVPDRLAEGYGPTPEAMRKLAGEGMRLVVTVDCGTTSHAAMAAAAAASLDVIIVDHHAPDAALPPATALINPKRSDDTSGLDHLAAVGVAFLLVVAVNRALRAAGFYGDRPEPDLRQWLDLVALGTVCDCVPLIGVNRAMVVQGFKVMAAWGNPGLKALAAIGKLSGTPSAEHAGFIFGPRINAAGRVGEAGLGARLLACDDAHASAAMARRLEQANQARRRIEAAVFDEAMARAERADGPLLFIAGEGWHPGVVGIVASRLVERFHRPACVVGMDGASGTGSGRSVPGIDLGAAVLAAREAGLLERGGGHAMAAGFRLARANAGALESFLAARMDVAAEPPPLELDGVVRTSGDAAALADGVARLGPFGVGNPEPRFALADVRLVSVATVRGDHVRCIFEDGAGRRLDAMAFRAGTAPVGIALRHCDGAPLHVAGRVRRNERGGNRPQLLIEDVARTG